MSVALIFEQNFATSTQIANRYNHNLCRRRKILCENEHHARILDIIFVPRSRFEHIEIAILVDVARF